MEYNMIGTIWSLLPPVVAITLALKTKEVYSSLFTGIVLGAILYCISVGSGFVSGGENGLTLFCKAIPYNFYAFFTLIFMFGVVLLGFDFQAMSKYDAKLEKWYRKNGIEPGKVTGTKLEVVGHGGCCVR